MKSFIPLVFTVFILTGAMSSCKDDPVSPPNGKDTCDTCSVDTTDTTATPNPNDTTSHAFLWTESAIAGEASLTGCWVFDDTTIWVVSNSLYELKGSASRRMRDFSSGTSIFGFTTKDVWFVYSGILWHYDGIEYKEIRLSKHPYNAIDPQIDGAFRAAWGTSSRDMFFVGDKGTIVHFDGSNWTKFPKVTEKNLRSVWGTSSRDDVWASGFNSSTAETVLLHYDGTSWTEADISRDRGIYATGGFNGVWAADSAGHKFVTASGALLVRRTDNGPWRSDSGWIPNRLSDGTFVGIVPFGNTPNDMFAIGGWGFTAHWNGRSWHRYDELFDYNNLNYGAAAFSIKGNTACIVGVKNGRSWIAVGRRK
jgi:hypothetical protein